jgi:hypothetical protein
MDDKIEPGEAGKAQAIWGAAFPERAPLASQACPCRKLNPNILMV